MPGKQLQTVFDQAFFKRLVLQQANTKQTVTNCIHQAFFKSLCCSRGNTW